MPLSPLLAVSPEGFMLAGQAVIALREQRSSDLAEMFREVLPSLEVEALEIWPFVAGLMDLAMRLAELNEMATGLDPCDVLRNVIHIQIEAYYAHDLPPDEAE